MALKNGHSFIFSPQFHPDHNTVINRNSTGSCEFITVGFDYLNKDGQLIIDTAIKLQRDGVQMIELCGGFSPS